MRDARSWIEVMGVVARNELRLVMRQRTACLMYVVFAAFSAYATFDGLQHVEPMEGAISKLLEEQDSRHAQLIEHMHAIYSGEEKPDLYFRADSPSWVGGSLGARYAVMPQDRLAPLALGQTDLLTDHYRVTSYDKTSFVLQDPLHNPWRLLDGPFDPAFVIIYLLPLFVIGLTYDLIAANREDGTLALLLATPAPPTAWIAGKVAARCGILLLSSIAIPAIFVLWRRGGADAALDLASWSAIALAYGLFWISLSVAINTWPRASAGNALALCGIWVGLVFVLPVALNAAIIELAPAPSRIDMIGRIRDVLAGGLERYRAMDTEDYHPELAKTESGKVFIQGYQKAFWAAQQDIKPHTDALFRDAREQLSKQQAIVGMSQFLSPAILAHEAMTTIAGTDVVRFLSFFDQMAEFHDRRQFFFFPLVAAETRLTDAHYDNMPRYRWREPSLAEKWRTIGASLMGQLAPAAALLLIAVRRIRLGLLRD